jgi:hypothetical protein
MIGLLCFVLAVLASPFKSKLRLEAENATHNMQLHLTQPKLGSGCIRRSPDVSSAITNQTS